MKPEINQPVTHPNIWCRQAGLYGVETRELDVKATNQKLHKFGRLEIRRISQIVTS